MSLYRLIYRFLVLLELVLVILLHAFDDVECYGVVLDAFYFVWYFAGQNAFK